MSFLLSNRALLRGILAGAVVLAGTACSRSDRSQSARDNSEAVLPDTASAQPSGGGTVTAHSDSLALPSTSAQSNSPRVETAPVGDTDAAGYRPMERDTTNVPSQQTDTAALNASADGEDTTSTEMAGATDTTASAGVSADTSVAGYAEMARDTSTVADQADTAATPSGDVALQASTDTSAQAEADVRAEADVVVAGAADTAGNAGRIRPPEDSTEILGADEAADETADEQVIRPEDRETVAASAPADEVGAAAIGGNVTGTEAVALLSRQGVRCAVVDPEANEAVRWDMSSTPVTLNPCGMGSMVLSRIWTRLE